MQCWATIDLTADQDSEQSMISNLILSDRENNEYWKRRVFLLRVVWE